MELDIRPSALKHGITSESIDHAVTYAMYADDFQETEPPKMLILGPDGAGNVLAGQERFEEAIEQYRKADERWRKTEPKNRKIALSGWAISLFQLGRYRDSIAQLEEAGEQIVFGPAMSGKLATRNGQAACCKPARHRLEFERSATKAMNEQHARAPTRRTATE